MGDEGGKKVFSVSELTSNIKSVIEAKFSGLWVEGEISKFHIQQPSGHAYITLKDEKAVIDAAMWKGIRARLKFEPKIGDLVVCRGKLSVYEPRGTYQLLIESMEPKGLGALQAAFEALKKKLGSEGLFKQERKKPLPFIPWRVGIVTSPTGAVIKDIIKTLNRRFPGLHIIINPVKVQGEGAADQIARAIAEFNQYGNVDVIIAGRGGGSLEDLWAFNEEVVARAIAVSKIPVVSAVGHETDFTIADFVADLRASTPTAAAEQVAPEREAVEDLIADLAMRMESQLRGSIETIIQDVDGLSDRANRAMANSLESMSGRFKGAYRHMMAISPEKQLALRRQRLSEFENRIARSVLRQAKIKGISISNLTDRMKALRPQRWAALKRELLHLKIRELTGCAVSAILSFRKRVDVAHGRLEAFSPQRALDRGYSIITTLDGKRVLKSARALTAGDRVKIRMRDGEKKATIDSDGGASQGKLF